MILTVGDPDTVFAQALAAGASEIFPVGEAQGRRLGRLVDPMGPSLGDWPSSGRLALVHGFEYRPGSLCRSDSGRESKSLSLTSACRYVRIRARGRFCWVVAIRGERQSSLAAGYS
jgi:hypothetical protein